MKSPGDYLPGPLLYCRIQVWFESIFVWTGLMSVLVDWIPL